jgi:hypothetical protein
MLSHLFLYCLVLFHYISFQDDVHDPSVGALYKHSVLSPYKQNREKDMKDAGVCVYELYVYPSKDLIQSYTTKKPAVYTCLTGCVFLIMAMTFYMFNRYIQLRNSKVILAAARSNAIVSNIFPSTVRDRLLREEGKKKKESRYLAVSSGIRDFLHTGESCFDEDDGELVYQVKPIADLFPEVRHHVWLQQCAQSITLHRDIMRYM